MLNDLAFPLGKWSVHITHICHWRRLLYIKSDAQFIIEQFLGIHHHPEYPDTTGDGIRHGKNTIGLACNVITT
ncbi:hypothetical protein D3C86_1612670 [compost metagenome]